MAETAFVAFGEGVEFIQVEYNHVAEAYAFVLVAAYQFREERTQRRSGAQGYGTEFSFFLPVLDFRHDFVGNLLYAFFRSFIDIGRDFLATGQYRAFHRVFRTVVAWRNPVQ